MHILKLLLTYKTHISIFCKAAIPIRNTLKYILKNKKTIKTSKINVHSSQDTWSVSQRNP